MDTYNDSNKEQNGPKLSFFALANNIISELPERTREIVGKRFGLMDGEPQTLEKIGKDHKITRERVRQIISDALKKISKKKSDADFKNADEEIIFAIKNNNGIIKENELIEKSSLGSIKEANAVKFFGALSDNIEQFEENEIIEKSWFIYKDAVEKAKRVSAVAEEFFKKNRQLLSDEEIAEKITEKMADLGKEESLNLLSVLSKIKKNKFGKWGLSSWEEVNPKGTRERIYLVLKEKNKPLHFTEISKLIDEYKLGKKKAHPQTVHNELIKDGRFVLVGRGIYALKEWGFKKGTIKDVLEEILRKSEKAMTKEEILDEVMKIRKVKKATVLINLNNSKVFAKENNLYRIKK